MATTIQITEMLQKELSKKKIFEKETYEEVIWDLLEDTKELNQETKKELQEAREEYQKGKISTLQQVRKELGF
ncbi:MAG: hypothetical protein QT08_C0022G0014 [archaeon GW2011_AR17]|nr:MAG: hypothetical protein QT08_C0022G0014 [archaeon GW2011_AR17]MBS3154564.1 hypothetical protein [Candidatus Woesearchaeota archaeon]HIH15521.1 hypothetical protein [Nanoarchaeota archaeon]HIH59510.1 hypothetical protein [Nanoarchaeota archaeon]HII14114.1 hypothetical protein [Nanoarchaeota archaeon]